MTKKLILFIAMLSLSFIACGQESKQTKSKQIKKENQMDYSKLTNKTVKSAIEALQNGDKLAWYNHFTSNAIFTDDGRTLDLKTFFDNAFQHKEKFLTFDKIEKEGTSITGNFFAGQWGTFRVFFTFTVNSEGKISKLDIGQVK